MSGRRTGSALTVGAATLLAAAAAAGSAQVHAASSTVVVTMTSAEVQLVPGTVLAGQIVFKIVNKGKVPRNFTIAGKRTPQIAVGKSATLTVELTTKGPRPYLSVSRGRPSRIAGLLNVLEPCENPATTTVGVQMAQDHGAITVSQSAVPCGSVTFVVTNTGTMVDSLHLFADLPLEKGSTPELNPGQTATLTIRFTAKGIAHYESGDYPPAEPEYGGDFGEQGQLSIV